MTTEEEAQYIQQVLPLMVKEPEGFDISEFGGKGPNKPVTDQREFISLAKRLVGENLAIADSNYAFYLDITPKGKQIAEQPGGYLGYLKEQEKRQRTEEFRAKLNVVGTFGSMVIAGLAFLFSVYIYVKAGEVKELQQKVDAQNERIKALEAQRNH
jgi:hypothetical protein